MNALPVVAIYCLLIALISWGGGYVPRLMRMNHTRMHIMMSFVGGLMLGVALLHMLPHAAESAGGMDNAMRAALLGLLVMFLLIRVFHVHQHEPLVGDESAVSCGHADAEPHHQHEHHHHAAGHGHVDFKSFSWTGLAIGLSLHTLIDGFALASAVVVEAGDRVWSLAGLATFLAVALHKPLDALSITTLMTSGGWAPRRVQLVNLAFALMCPLGAVCYFLGMQQFVGVAGISSGMVLGFAAGVFLCIALADILPEVQFHTHDRFKLTAALLLGVLVAFGVGYLEPDHVHGPAEQGEHSHQGHDH